jgi:hypothetical protein
VYNFTELHAHLTQKLNFQEKSGAKTIAPPQSGTAPDTAVLAA